MELKSRVQSFVDHHIKSGHVPREVDSEFYKQIKNAKSEDGRLLKITPYPENDGIQATEEFYQSVHDLTTDWTGLRNESAVEGFEIWFDEGKIQFFFYVPNERAEKKFRKQLDAEFPQAMIEDHGDILPEIYDGDYIAGTELTLKQGKYYPIKSSRGVKEFINDPYRSITSDMLSTDENRSVVQVLYKPAMHSWSNGGPLGDFNPWATDVKKVANSLKNDQLESTTFGFNERAPTKEERQLADVVAEQDGLPAYHINVRILTISPYPNEAASNAWSIGKTFEQGYQEAGDQSFVQNPVSGDSLDSLILNTAGRNYHDQGMVLTIPELAALAHVPNQSIETPAVQWNYTQTGGRVPADAERFDQSLAGEADTANDKPASIAEMETMDEVVHKQETEETTQPPDSPAPQENHPGETSEANSHQADPNPREQMQNAVKDQSTNQQNNSSSIGKILGIFGLSNSDSGLQPAAQDGNPFDRKQEQSQHDNQEQNNTQDAPYPDQQPEEDLEEAPWEESTEPELEEHEPQPHDDPFADPSPETTEDNKSVEDEEEIEEEFIEEDEWGDDEDWV